MHCRYIQCQKSMYILTVTATRIFHMTIRVNVLRWQKGKRHILNWMLACVSRIQSYFFKLFVNAIFVCFRLVHIFEIWRILKWFISRRITSLSFSLIMRHTNIFPNLRDLRLSQPYSRIYPYSGLWRSVDPILDGPWTWR
jgi:hypothetical protein